MIRWPVAALDQSTHVVDQGSVRRERAVIKTEYFCADRAHVD
jgi:hypothetical protein